MKKFSVSIALLTVGMFMSCTKDYTCECTTKSSSTSSDGQGTTVTTTSDPEVNTVVYKDVKKSNLPVSCKDYTQVYSSTNTTGTVTATEKDVDETTCTIK